MAISQALAALMECLRYPPLLDPCRAKRGPTHVDHWFSPCLRGRRYLFGSTNRFTPSINFGTLKLIRSPAGQPVSFMYVST